MKDQRTEIRDAFEKIFTLKEKRAFGKITKEEELIKTKEILDKFSDEDVERILYIVFEKTKNMS